MNPPRDRKRSADVALFVVGSLVLAGLLAAAGWWLAAGQRQGSPNAVYAGPAGPSPEATSTAPAAAIRRIHIALLDIGRECLLPAATRVPARIDADVDTILRFTRDYPVGRFVIEDETGSAQSLLLVTRQALRDCSPRNAARIDARLPPFQRDAGGLPPTPPPAPAP